MVVDDLLPLLASRGLETGTIGLLGWSMGGYGALRLGALLGPRRVAGSGRRQPGDLERRPRRVPVAEYDDFSVVGRQADLDGVAVRVDCGTGDPFYRDVQDHVAGFPTMRT